MKFLFDANLSHTLVKALDVQFPNSAHVRDVGLRTATDDEIWDYAKLNEFTIVSKDRRQHMSSGHEEAQEMAHRFVPQTSLLILPLALLSACTTTPRPAAGDAEQVEEIRQAESERLRSLVSADLPTARRLHADDFQLINPAGAALTKTEYLGQIESGDLDYRAWEAGEIAVRLYGDAAMIRYRDVRFDVDRQGQPVHRGPMYHTNLYERRGGQWQIVWSQASGVITPPSP